MAEIRKRKIYAGYYDRYEKLMSQYQSEQKDLTVSVTEGRKKLEDTEEKKVDVRRLIKTLREMTDV